MSSQKSMTEGLQNSIFLKKIYLVIWKNYREKEEKKRGTGERGRKKGRGGAKERKMRGREEKWKEGRDKETSSVCPFTSQPRWPQWPVPGQAKI